MAALMLLVDEELVEASVSVEILRARAADQTSTVRAML